MAGIDLGEGSKRTVNSEINMIPFIDFLLVLIAFLLITAVWVTYSRMEVDARQPGATTGPVVPGEVSKDLHLHANEDHFVLIWKQASTVISETRLPRPSTPAGAQPHYPDLAKQIAKEWQQHGSHTDSADPRLDRCVLHTDDALPFGEIVAVMDAVYTAKRDFYRAGRTNKVSAFNVAFASR